MMTSVSSLTVSQIVGSVLVAVFLAIYVYLIVFLYSESKPESKTRLKEQMRKGVSLLHSHSIPATVETAPIPVDLAPKRQRIQSILGTTGNDDRLGGNAAAKSSVVIGRLLKELTTGESSAPPIPSLLELASLEAPSTTVYNPINSIDLDPTIAFQVQSSVTSPLTSDDINSQLKPFLTDEHLLEIDHILVSEAVSGIDARNASIQEISQSYQPPPSPISPLSLVDTAASVLDDSSTCTGSISSLFNRIDSVTSEKLSISSIVKLNSVLPDQQLPTVIVTEARIRDSTPPRNGDQWQLINASNRCHCTVLSQLTSQMTTKIISIDLSNQLLNSESVTIIGTCVCSLQLSCFMFHVV